MKAVVITPQKTLELRDAPRPVPAAGQVLVRVHATAVNRADLLQVAGRYPVPAGSPPDIPGLEFAGEVAEAGPGVEGWRGGERVFGIAGGGTYAEYVVVHAGALAAIPRTLDDHAAAAVPEAFITAHDALITQAGLQPAEAVLIHAVGSGVGLAAVQVARWRGAIPYGTTRTAAKLEAARVFGLEDGVVVTSDLAIIRHAMARWCGDSGAAVVLDLVGGAYLPEGVEALGHRGRLILVGTVAGNHADVKLAPILRKRLRIQGTVLRARSDAEKAATTAAFVRDLVPALSDGSLRAPIHAVLPLDRVQDAHAMVAADENTGKVVLAIR